jgi:hypothetical protein
MLCALGAQTRSTGFFQNLSEGFVLHFTTNSGTPRNNKLRLERKVGKAKRMCSDFAPILLKDKGIVLFPPLHAVSDERQVM